MAHTLTTTVKDIDNSIWADFAQMQEEIAASDDLAHLKALLGERKFDRATKVARRMAKYGNLDGAHQLHRYRQYAALLNMIGKHKIWLPYDPAKLIERLPEADFVNILKHSLQCRVLIDPIKTALLVQKFLFLTKEGGKLSPENKAKYVSWTRNFQVLAASQGRWDWLEEFESAL